MPSSRTDEQLGSLAALYADGFEAALGLDLARVAAVLDRADALLAQIAPPGDDDEGAVRAREAATEAFGRLRGAIANAVVDTRADIAKVKNGRKAARGYLSDRRERGLRHDTTI